MNRIVFICFYAVFLCIYTGCVPRGDRVATGDSQKKGSIAEKKVELQSKSGDNSFSAFLAGKWKAKDSDDCKWEFTFEKDGTISAMRNFMGTYVRVSQGIGYEHYASDANVEAACVLGPVDVLFDPQSRVLTVKVVTDYFMFHIYSGMVEGSSVDKFSGTVSQDGSTWNAEWQDFSRMLDGPPMDFNNPLINQVVFYKVREKVREEDSK
ncbi:MAG: hypothetical protein ABSE89_08960 [Sedimentisphaerales bacterium]